VLGWGALGHAMGCAAAARAPRFRPCWMQHAAAWRSGATCCSSARRRQLQLRPAGATCSSPAALGCCCCCCCCCCCQQARSLEPPLPRPPQLPDPGHLEPADQALPLLSGRRSGRLELPWARCTLRGVQAPCRGGVPACGARAGGGPPLAHLIGGRGGGAPPPRGE
jgi:hypothetical protein